MNRLLTLLVVLAAISLPACSTQEIVSLSREIHDLKVQVADAEAQLVVAEAQPENAAKREKIEKIRKFLTESRAVLARAEVALEGADDGFDVANAGLQATTPLFGPWGAIVGLIGTTVLGFARAGWNRHLARKVAKSVEPVVQAAVSPKTEHATDIAEKISDIQGNSGERIVDESQGKKFALPV